MTPARLRSALSAGARLAVLTTTEEDRGLEVVEDAAEGLGWPLHSWTAATGADEDGVTGLEELLSRLDGDGRPQLWALLDPGDTPPTPRVRRRLREVAQRTSGPALVVIQPDAGWIGGIPEAWVETLPLPDAVELAEGAALGLADLQNATSESDADTIARAGVGLTRAAFEHLLAEGLQQPGATPGSVAQHVADAKPGVLARGALLERVPAAPLAELGGLASFKTWLQKRARALEPGARLAAIPPPRGVLLVGISGCGKSLAARVCGTVFGTPILRLDPGRLFGATVGTSEGNLRQVLRTVDRLAPVVLWLDEVEKGLAGAEGAASDAGTAARVVGALLTWLQEREHAVFVVATANRMDALPPELLRRGRLDEVFFVDLPGAEDRAEILRVHLSTVPARRLESTPPLADAEEDFLNCARDAEGFTGAELEAALVEARLAAYAEGRPVAASDLRDAVRATVPLSRTHAEAVAALREWARERARLA